MRQIDRYIGTVTISFLFSCIFLFYPEKLGDRKEQQITVRTIRRIYELRLQEHKVKEKKQDLLDINESL